MEAVLARDVAGEDVGAVADAASVRGELYGLVEQVTWGGTRQFAARLAPFGLTLQQYFTLVAINQAEGCTMSALAAATHHSFGTMTGIVDRLVRQKFVVRQSDPHDRRVVLVYLTVAGAEMLAHIEDMRAVQFDAVLESLGELQARNLIRLLTQYADAAGITGADATTVAFA